MSGLPRKNLVRSQMMNDLLRRTSSRLCMCAGYKKPKKLLKYLQNVSRKTLLGYVYGCVQWSYFCNRIKTVKFVADFMGAMIYRCMHGEMPNGTRKSLQISSEQIDPLVATDVVSRGMDIKTRQCCKLRYAAHK